MGVGSIAKLTLVVKSVRPLGGLWGYPSNDPIRQNNLVAEQVLRNCFKEIATLLTKEDGASLLIKSLLSEGDMKFDIIYDVKRSPEHEDESLWLGKISLKAEGWEKEGQDED